MNWRLNLLALLMAGGVQLAFAGQAVAAEPGKSAPAGVSGVAGKVVSVDAAHKSVKLEHEAVKALGWPAMTMDFRVADGVPLNGLQPGMSVLFDLGKGADGRWQITRIAPGAAAPGMAR